jgi:anti-sigma factor RsiW
MISRLDSLPLRWRHAGTETLSRYLEGDLSQRRRAALESHLRTCPDCRSRLESLASTVTALGTLRSEVTPGLVDSVIAAIRAESPTPDLTRARSSPRRSGPALTVVSGSRADSLEPAIARRRACPAARRAARSLLDYCLRRPQLRVTLPLALVVGVALSLINQGDMIFSGRVDVGMCAVCALNFVIPFIALNVGLLLATRVAVLRRPRAGRDMR